MDVRKILISEFTNLFAHHGYKVTERVLEIAESPFNIQSVQLAVDNDIDKVHQEHRNRLETERRRIVQKREKMHEEQLRKLAREYALKLLQFIRRGHAINESIALNEQQNLKKEAGRGCDIYPCEHYRNLEAY